MRNNRNNKTSKDDNSLVVKTIHTNKLILINNIPTEITYVSPLPKSNYILSPWQAPYHCRVQLITIHRINEKGRKM